jgi:hypothetical protein
VKPGSVPFSIDDSATAAEQARAFCVSRGLSVADVKIVRRDGKIEVEARRECTINLEK